MHTTDGRETVLGVTWKDKVTNEEIRRRKNQAKMEDIITKIMTGIVRSRLPNGRQPRHKGGIELETETRLTKKELEDNECR
jgi:hypothetical protein